MIIIDVVKGDKIINKIGLDQDQIDIVPYDGHPYQVFTDGVRHFIVVPK